MGKRKRGLDIESLNGALREALAAADAGAARRCLNKGASPDVQMSVVLVPAGGKKGAKKGSVSALAWCLDWRMAAQGGFCPIERKEALCACAMELLKNGAKTWERDGCSPDGRPETALATAAWAAPLAIGRELLARMRAQAAGARIEAAQQQAAIDAALGAAAKAGVARADWTNWLLAEGADPFSARNGEGQAALCKAAAAGHLGPVEVFLALPWPEEDAANSEGSSAAKDAAGRSGKRARREAATALAWTRALDHWRSPLGAALNPFKQRRHDWLGVLPDLPKLSESMARAVTLNPAQAAPFSKSVGPFVGDLSEKGRACARRLSREVDLSRAVESFSGEALRQLRDPSLLAFKGLGGTGKAQPRRAAQTLRELGQERAGKDNWRELSAWLEAKSLEDAIREGRAVSAELDGDENGDDETAGDGPGNSESAETRRIARRI